MSLKEFLDRHIPKPTQSTQNFLGWMLVVLLIAAGSLKLYDPPIAFHCYVIAVAVCPRVPIPDWVRVLFVLYGLYILTNSNYADTDIYR